MCNPDVPDHIVCLQAAAPSIRKQRCRHVRNVSSDQEVQVTEAFLRELDIYIDSHPSYKMLGPEFVLSTALNNCISKQDPFIQSVEDIREQYGVRPDLCAKVFDAIQTVMGNIRSALGGVQNSIHTHINRVAM